MNTREAVWRAALNLSHSADFQDRAIAAHCLVPFVGFDSVDARLIALVHDPENTFVTETAVEALARREDLPGWQLIATAYATEPDEHTRDHMTDALWECVINEDRIRTARAALKGLEELWRNTWAVRPLDAGSPVAHCTALPDLLAAERVKHASAAASEELGEMVQCSTSRRDRAAWRRRAPVSARNAPQ